MTLGKQLLGPVEAQFVDQLLVAAALFAEVTAQGARRAVHLPGQPFQARRSAQLSGEQLADARQPGLTPGELQVQLPAALAHGPVGDLIGQRQRLVQPVAGEGKGVVAGVELQRAGETLAVERVIVGGAVGEARAEQGQRLTEQVVADHFQRGQAELGVEGGQVRFFAVVAGAEPDLLAVIDQA